jgi:hypothetical protein
MDKGERQAVITAATARIRSFEAAERARDAEAVVAQKWAQWLIVQGHITLAGCCDHRAIPADEEFGGGSDAL